MLAALLLAAAADTYRVSLPENAAPAGASGRVILFFIDDESRQLGGADPREAPFFRAPQPVASVPVTDFRPGQSIEIGANAASWPAPFADFVGPFRVQAVFKCNPDEGSHRAYGNPFSPVTKVDLNPLVDETIDLTLSGTPDPPIWVREKDREPESGLAWVEMRSEVLSAARGHDVYLRAGVAFPPGYHDVNATRRVWPTVYVVPGFGDRHDGARRFQRIFEQPGASQIAVPAVHVVLDPEGPFGHHGFVDSECNGLVGTALVTELIPHLESKFRLV